MLPTVTSPHILHGGVAGCIDQVVCNIDHQLRAGNLTALLSAPVLAPWLRRLEKQGIILRQLHGVRGHPASTRAQSTPWAPALVASQLPQGRLTAGLSFYAPLCLNLSLSSLHLSRSLSLPLAVSTSTSIPLSASSFAQLRHACLCHILLSTVGLALASASMRSQWSD